MTSPASLRHGLPLPLVAAATTWLVMLSWKGFSVAWGEYLGPLLLVALVVAVLGVLLRLSALPRRGAALVQVLAVAVLVWLLLGGAPWHPFSSTGDISDALADASTSSSTYASPIPASVPGIAPILIPCGALSLLVIDFLACWLRRVPLAGLPLLAVYCVPISLLGGGVSWVVFLLAAAGFMLMLVLQETEHVARWGRPLGTASNGDPYGFGVNTGASRATATTVGSVAAMLAVVLPIFIPTLHLGSLGLFGPGGPGGGVKVVNPITDMRRDLMRGQDVPLLDITTDDPDPSYFRIAVLTKFNGVEWSTGDRAIVRDQVANGIVPLPQGLNSNLPMPPYNYSVQATQDFDSTWLPTAYPVISINASGDWHYDRTTMDFIAGNDHTNTAGLSYTMTGVKPRLSAYSMVNSLNAELPIQTTYTQLPSSLPRIVRLLAARVTQKAGNSRLRSVVALQDWFREKGGFRYSLKTNPGDGNDALAQFLIRGNGGRVGYCEQFASAFAAMARSLRIPTRVAIGFLQPTKVGNTWVYSAHDLHAWPEVYFRGSGWVRFEPTPGQRAGTVPAYSTGQITKPSNPSGGPTSRRAVPTESTKPTQSRPDPTTGSSSSSGGPQVPWVVVLVAVVVLAILAVLASVPRAVRRSRRRRRLTGGVEEAWAELRDSALDLGVAWPHGRSPHDTGVHLVGWFGPEPDGAPQVRPPRGAGLAPAAEDALDRIVLTLERVRYSRHADDVPGGLAEDVMTCAEALEHGSTRRTLRRSQWLPLSLFGRRARAAAAADRDRQPEVVARGGLVDHVR